MRTTMPVAQHLCATVTAERSPPDSRMTGADSPVIADSSTEAMPSMISPSEGIDVTSLTHDEVAFAEIRRSNELLGPIGFSRRASVSERILRRVSA